MRKWLKRLRNEEGFTLIEMTIVILVIAILMIVFIPNVSKVNDNVGETTNDALRQTVEAQMILYEAKNGRDVDADALATAGFITTDQADAYKKLPEKAD